MSILPFLAVAGASLALSGFDLSRKLLGRHLAPLPMVALLATASIPLFGLLTWLAGDSRLSPGYAAPALGSIALNLGAHVAFLEAVRRSPLSLTVPLLSLTPVFTAFAGLLLLGERPTPAGIAGIVLVVVGALWLHRVDRPDPAPGLARFRFSLRKPGVWLMTTAALLWSVSLPLDKMAVGLSSPALHGLVLTSGISVGALAFLAQRRRLGELKEVRGCPGIFLVALCASTVALGLQLVAIQWVLVSLVETAKRGVGNLAAVVLGRSVFREPLTLAKVGAALLMSVGVALLLL